MISTKKTQKLVEFNGLRGSKGPSKMMKTRKPTILTKNKKKMLSTMALCRGGSKDPNKNDKKDKNNNFNKNC